jgi:hypothetical protein
LDLGDQPEQAKEVDWAEGREMRDVIEARRRKGN